MSDHRISGCHQPGFQCNLLDNINIITRSQLAGRATNPQYSHTNHTISTSKWQGLSQVTSAHYNTHFETKKKPFKEPNLMWPMQWTSGNLIAWRNKPIWTEYKYIYISHINLIALKNTWRVQNTWLAGSSTMARKPGLASSILSAGPCNWFNVIPSRQRNKKKLRATLLGTNILPKKHFVEDDVPFPQAGYVSSLEGRWNQSSHRVYKILSEPSPWCVLSLAGQR